MSDGVDRRGFLRVALPAVAMPMVAAQDAVRPDQVTKDEIMEALGTSPYREITADFFNRRFKLLLDVMFEADPAVLREQLEVLRDERRNALYLNVTTGEATTRDDFKEKYGYWPEEQV